MLARRIRQTSSSNGFSFAQLSALIARREFHSGQMDLSKVFRVIFFQTFESGASITISKQICKIYKLIVKKFSKCSVFPGSLSAKLTPTDPFFKTEHLFLWPPDKSKPAKDNPSHLSDNHR